MNGFGADEIFGGYFSHQIFYILSNYKSNNIKYLIKTFKKIFIIFYVIQN